MTTDPQTDLQKTAIPLLVTGIDLDNEATLDVIGAQFDNLTWHSEAGQIIATLHTTSGDPIADVLEIARMVVVMLPDARVSGVDPQLVALSDIADRLAISSEAVRLWAAGKRRAGTPFPAPAGRVSTGRTVMKIWSWPAVLTWLRQEFHLDPEPDVCYLSGQDSHTLAIRLSGLDVTAVAS